MIKLKEITYYFSKRLNIWIAQTQPPGWQKSLYATGDSRDFAVNLLKKLAGDRGISCPQNVLVYELPVFRQRRLEKTLNSRLATTHKLAAGI